MASPTTEKTSHLSLDHFSCSTLPSSAPNELTASSTKGKDSKLCAIRNNSREQKWQQAVFALFVFWDTKRMEANIQMRKSDNEA